MPSQPQPPQAKQFSLFFFAYYGYVGVFTPYASLYFAQRGMSAAQIGILMSLMQVMRIFGPNFWGSLADRSQRRVHILRMTACAALLSFLGMFWGQNFLHFFIIMVLVNAFTSGQGPLSEAALVSSMQGDLTWYGRLRLWGSVGFIVAVMLAGQGLEWWGIDLMPTFACIMLAMVVLAAFLLKETAAEARPRNTPSLWSLLRQREVMAFFTSTCLMVMSHSALYVFYSLYLEKLGYGKTMIGVLWSLGVLAEIAFFFYQAPVVRRFGMRQLMLISLALAVLRFFMIAYAEAGWLGLLVLIIAQAMHAATFGIHHSASVLQLQRWFGGPLQASGQALYTSISYGIGGTVGGILMGIGWDQGGARAVFLAASAMSALALLAAMLSFRWQRQSDALKNG